MHLQRDLIQPTRVFGLRLINIILETGGEALGQHPSLIGTCQRDLCKYLIHSSRTQELPVLSLTLRVVFNLFNSLKQHLKVQLEVFFTSVHLWIADSRYVTVLDAAQLPLTLGIAQHCDARAARTCT